MLSRSKLYVVATVLSLFMNVQSPRAQSARPVQPQGIQVTAFASGEQMRFISLGELIELRLEVINSSGEVVFDSGFKSGNVLDWELRDKEDNKLRDGSYLCVVTVKSFSGEIARRNAIANVVDHSTTLKPAEPHLITPAQADAVAIEDQTEGLTILDPSSAAASAVLAHDGRVAHLVSGRGGLSISSGDFFANRVLEHIRLTVEGNLGIGISSPQTKLDVAGLIRTNAGIVFPDGTIQYSAARKTFGPVSLRPGESRQAQGQAAPLAIDVSGTGTTGKIPKWQDGPTGALNDSNITELNSAIGINGSPNTNFRLDVNGSTRIRGSNPGFNLEGLRAGGNIWLFQTVDDNGRFRLFSQDNVNPGIERLTISLSTGNVGIGVTSPTSRLDVSADLSTSAIKGANASTIVFSRGVHGAATGASGATIGVLGESASTSGTGVAGLANSNTGITSGVSGQSDSTSGRGVYGFASAASGTTFGGRFESASTSGRGVYGSATAATGTTYGGRFESASTSGRGVYGLASAASGITYGGYFESSSDFGGTGVRGVSVATGGFAFGGRFESASTDGRGVSGTATAATGVAYGGQFVSASTDGSGVYGEATAASGFTYGGDFYSASSDGRGVEGRASSPTGITTGVYGLSISTSGRGVLGWATNPNGTNYGVVGVANAINGNSYGVFAQGDVGATGNKPFRIDHPDDPANKYLLHYAAESPEVINFYSGKATLDAAGEAVVELPRYFAKINRDPRYMLTAMGAPMPMLHIGVEIDEAALSAGARAEPGQAAPVCSFRIAGGVPGAKVSWRVEALRNDRWVQKRGAPVEVIKQDLEKGTYQHPELYGQPPEKGLNYSAPRERPKPARP